VTFRPKLTLWFITILFFSGLILAFFSQLGEYTILFPSNLKQPWNWYKLITYPFAGVGLLNWLTNSLVLILTGYIIENHIIRSDMIKIIILSSVIGGLIFIIFNQNDVYNRGIASPTMISWGYWAATIIIGVKFWRELNLFEKIILILCFLSITSLFFEDIGFLLGQIAVIICIMTFTLIRIKNNKLMPTRTIK